MKTIEINAKKRTSLGKKATKALRKENNVPCVIYGQKQDNVHFYAHRNEFKNLVYTPNSYLVDLNIDGEKYIAKMQSIDFHPVTDEITHIDFYRIDLKKEFKIEVPIATTGFAKGIQAGGVLGVARRKVLVKALAENLPDELTLDITDLGIGDAIRINDLKELYPNLEFLDPQSIVVSINMTRLAKSLAGEAGEEGEEEDEATEE
ncbi:MAG: 50S ribosomal protein L25 [Chlorobi bacterium]|nr:50S ribosomal protein L25 [Chlorobiota bacterium]